MSENQIRKSYADMRDDAPYPAGVSHDLRLADELLADAQMHVSETLNPDDSGAHKASTTIQEAIDLLESAQEELE